MKEVQLKKKMKNSFLLKIEKKYLNLYKIQMNKMKLKNK